MQILKGTGIDWCKRRLISKLYMNQSVKLRMDQRGDKNYEDLKRSEKRVLFVTDCFQLQQMPYQGSSSRVWRLAK
jgi:hypothetical protein